MTLDGSSEPISVRVTTDPLVSYFNWEDATHEMVGTWTYKMKSYVSGYATNIKDNYPVMQVDILCGATLINLNDIATPFK